jgi:hypothetical protein
MIRIFTVVILLSHFNYAQKFHITYGDTFTTDRGSTEKFSEANSDAIYFINHFPQPEKDKIYLVNYGKEFWLNKIDLQTARFQYRFNLHDSINAERTWNKGYQYKTIHVLGNKVVFFTRIMDKGVDRLMMTPFDSKTGKRLSESADVYEISNKNLGVIMKGSSDFNVFTSPDRSKFAVVSERKRDYKEQDVKVHVFDASSLKLLWEAQAPSTFTNSTIFTSDYKLTNDGKLYFLFRYTQIEQTDLYGVGIMKNASEKAKLTALTQKDKWILEPGIEVTENGVSLHATYLETTMRMFSQVCPSGFYDAIFDADVRLLGEFASETKNSLGIKNDDLNAHTHVGSFSVGKDWYIVREHAYYVPPDIRKEEYVYVTKINKEGKLEWLKQVPRKIESMDCTGLLARASDKEVQLIYYEDKSNAEQYPDLASYDGKKYKAVRKLSNASLVCVSVTPDGKLKRSVIEHNGEFSLSYGKHRNHRQLDGRTFAVKCYDSKGKKSYCLLEVN